MELLKVHRGDDNVELLYTAPGAISEIKKNKGLFFEHPMLEAMAKLDYRRGLWLDVGANTGNHTIFMSRYCKADEIWSYEPNPLSFSVLKVNVKAWGIRSVRCFNCAVGDKKNRVAFTDNKENSGVNKVTNKGPKDTVIETLDIDAKVAVIKIDVEGYEKKVLKGAKRILERDKPELFIECFDEPESLLSLLPKGYKIVTRYNNAPTYHYSYE